MLYLPLSYIWQLEAVHIGVWPELLCSFMRTFIDSIDSTLVIWENLILQTNAQQNSPDWFMSNFSCMFNWLFYKARKNEE